MHLSFFVKFFICRNKNKIDVAKIHQSFIHKGSLEIFREVCIKLMVKEIYFDDSLTSENIYVDIVEHKFYFQKLITFRNKYLKASIHF